MAINFLVSLLKKNWNNAACLACYKRASCIPLTPLLWVSYRFAVS